SHVPLREVVIEWDRKIIHESQGFFSVFTQAIKKISGGRLLQTSSLSRFAHFDARRISSIAAGDNLSVLSSISQKCCRSKCLASRCLSAFNGFLDSAQMTDHPFCPA